MGKDQTEATFEHTDHTKANELFDKIKNEWAPIPNSYFESLILSMRIRAYNVKRNQVHSKKVRLRDLNIKK